MKIVQVCPFFYPVLGGMEKHVFDISTELVKRGHQVTVLTSNLTHDGKLEAGKENISGVEIIRLHSVFRLGFASFWPSLAKTLKSMNADVVHVHGYRHPHNFGVFFTKARTVLTPHWPEYPTSARGLFRTILTKLFDLSVGKTVLQKFWKVVALTDIEKEWLERKFNITTDKLDIIPNCIGNRYFKSYNSKRFRKKFGITEKYLVLSVGRVHKSKGYERIVRVAKLFSNTQFVIIGPDGGDLNRLQDLSRRLGVSDRILFTGQLPETEKLEAYAGSDVFCLPTEYEAFGIVLLEAMAQSKPILARNTGGVPSVVGDAGILFNETCDLEKKLKRLLKNKSLRENLSKKAKERAKQFTVQSVVDEIENLYSQY